MHFNGSVNACYSLNAFFPEWSEAEMRNVLMETNLEVKCTASRLKTGFMDANKRSDTFSTHSTYNLIKCTIDSQWFRLTHIAGLRVCGRVSFSSPHFLASSHSSHSTSLRMSRDNYSSFDVLFRLSSPRACIIRIKTFCGVDNVLIVINVAASSASKTLDGFSQCF